MTLEPVNREKIVKAFISNLDKKLTPEEILENRRLAKIEEQKIFEEYDRKILLEGYNRFYQINKLLPTNALDRSIENLKEENAELFGLIKNWDVFGNYGFCICGPVGTGKTYALLAILNHVTSTLVDSGRHVYGCVYWNTSAMMLEEFKDSFSENESILDKIEKIQSKSFLFIDDIGAHKLSDFSIEKLISILDFRVNNNLPTFFSTNCKIDQMKTTFGERIFSRIIATSVMVEIKGKDRRLDLHAERLNKLKQGAKT